MRLRFLSQIVGVGFICVMQSSCTSSQQPVERVDSARIAKLVGYPGTMNEKGDVFRVGVSRHDITTSINGFKLTGGLGLMAWASFSGTKTHTVLLGEVPLREDEVNGFLSRAIEQKIEVTSLHNTFLWDSPRVMSLHFTSTGDEDSLATSVGSLFSDLFAGRISRQKPSPTQAGASKGTLNLNTIHQFLWKGEFVDGAYHVSTGRGTEMAGVSVGESAGITSWASFEGSDKAAVVNGDIAALEHELNDVLKELLGAHLFVVSVHTHLTKETPRVMWVHFWGTGDLERLAKGVRAALDVQKNFRGSQ